MTLLFTVSKFPCSQRLVHETGAWSTTKMGRWLPSAGGEACEGGRGGVGAGRGRAAWGGGGGRVVPRSAGRPRRPSAVLPRTLPMAVILRSGLGNASDPTRAYWGTKG